MANYIIPENPEYTTEIRKLENTDPANAETVFNPLVETLIQNTHAVKLEADGKADADHTHRAENISEGILPLARGGTGQSSLSGIRNALGLGNTTGALPIANGGTGQTTAAGARNALGLGNTTGAVPVANGGTGGTTGAAACANLGAVKKSGDTMTGQLIAYNNTNYTTAQVRNILCSASDLTAGTSTLANGTLYFVYE